MVLIRGGKGRVKHPKKGIFMAIFLLTGNQLKPKLWLRRTLLRPELYGTFWPNHSHLPFP